MNAAPRKLATRTDSIQVWNDAGRAFNIRIVRTGEGYGRNDALVNVGEPMVEFYDDTFASLRFGPLGQFVARYNVSTLSTVTGGLSLDGGIPEWTVNANNVALALAYAAGRRI